MQVIDLTEDDSSSSTGRITNVEESFISSVRIFQRIQQAIVASIESQYQAINITIGSIARKNSISINIPPTNHARGSSEYLNYIGMMLFDTMINMLKARSKPYGDLNKKRASTFKEDPLLRMQSVYEIYKVFMYRMTNIHAQ